MSTSFGLSDIAPLGAGIELVDESDPAVTPRCLAIEAANLGEATKIIKKYQDYRLWHQLRSIGSHPDVMPPDGGGELADRIQKLYWHNEDESGYSDGAESVTLIFAKAINPQVTAKLSNFPASLPLRGRDNRERYRQIDSCQNSNGD